MPRFLIERIVPNAGRMTPRQLHDIAASSNEVLQSMQRAGTPIQWVESYVSDDKLQCVYIAPDATAVREHAHRSGFPCHAVTEITAVIGPTTGE